MHAKASGAPLFSAAHQSRNFEERGWGVRFHRRGTPFDVVAFVAFFLDTYCDESTAIVMMMATPPSTPTAMAAFSQVAFWTVFTGGAGDCLQVHSNGLHIPLDSGPMGLSACSLHLGSSLSLLPLMFSRNTCLVVA